MPLTRQCRLLNLSRSGIYYSPVPVSDRDRDFMRLMGEIHLEYPFVGTRGIRNELWNRGYKAVTSHIRIRMRKMGIEAISRYGTPQIFNTDQGRKTFLPSQTLYLAFSFHQLEVVEEQNQFPAIYR